MQPLAAQVVGVCPFRRGEWDTADVAPPRQIRHWADAVATSRYRIPVRHDGPLVVAHRGASAQVAEHTLAAYEQAIHDGSDALECDVRLTRDGHLVCVHDRRLERTSNGRGLVSERVLTDLHSLDFASWKDELPDSADEFVVERESYLDADRHAAVRRVLTFERLLELVVDCGRPVGLLVETKHPTRYSGLVEQKLVAALRRFGLAQPDDPYGSTVTIMSFSQLAVRRVRNLAPKVPTVLLFENISMLYRDGTLPFGATISGPGVHLLRANPGYVKRVHEAGNRVYVWTVDEPDDIELVLGLGVDAVITNRPAHVLNRLGRTSNA
jgi:glycerophosphoryl diester phosphodiesterase